MGIRTASCGEYGIPVATAIALFVLPGCFSAADPTPVSAADDSLLQALGLRVVDGSEYGSKEPWLVAKTEVGPAGAAIHVVFDIPEALVVDLAGDRVAATLLPVALPGDKDAVRDWGLVAFEETYWDDSETLTSMPTMQVDATVETRDSLSDTASSLRPPRMQPTTILIPVHGGDEASVVFFAKAARPIEIALLLHLKQVIAEDLPDGDQMVEGIDEPIHRANIVQAATGTTYSRVEVLDGVLRRTLDGAVSVDRHWVDEPTFHATLSVTAGLDVAYGWGALGLLGPADAQGVVDWSLEGSMHGTRFREQGQYHPVLGVANLSGVQRPAVFVQHRGEGPSLTNLSMEMHRVDETFDFSLEYIDIGMVPYR